MKIKVTVHCFNGDGERELELPGHYEVCPRCEGKGKHVNPAIDGNGLSAEDFAEDPDFKEDYFSGVYDVPCGECGGARVVAELDREALAEHRSGKRILKRIEERESALRECRLEEEAERRMGC